MTTPPRRSSFWTCPTAAIDSQPREGTPTLQAKSCESPHSDSDLCHHIIVRADLTPGQQIAQTAHAAGESVVAQVPSNTVVVALAARDQAHLQELAAKLVAAGIPHKLIVECDGESMAIGIQPTRNRKPLRKLLSQLPLAGRGLLSLPDQHALQRQRHTAQLQLRAYAAQQAALQVALQTTPWQLFKAWVHRHYKAVTLT